MDGITVLNETVQASKTCVLIIGILGLLALIVGIFLCLKNIAYFAAIILFIAVCFILFFIAVYPESGTTIQKISIDDSVKFNEFVDHYDIIDQEGDLYTVRVKDPENENGSKEKSEEAPNKKPQEKSEFKKEE